MDDERMAQLRVNARAALERMAPALAGAAVQAMQMIEDAKGDCETCGESEPWLRGIVLGANGPETVACCDECETYPGDLPAAYALAQIVRGVVKFWQHDAALVAVLERQAQESFDSHMRIRHASWAELGYEQRTYDGSGQADDCILGETYPWIEIDGQAVNWRHYWAIAAAMVKASAA